MTKVLGPYSKISFDRVSLSSPDQVKEFLYTQGWKPTQWNYTVDAAGKKVKSSPKITEDSFDSIEGEIGKLYLKWNSLTHRRDTIINCKHPETKGLFPYIREDGRIAAQAITLGTPTARYTHKVVANMPGVDKPYGYELRSCFSAAPGYIFIGADLKGIEANLMAHISLLFDDPEFADVILNTPDIHTWTLERFRDLGIMITRKQAKILRYALSYGAQAAKIATMLGVSLSEAEKIVDAFWLTQKGLARAKDALKKALKRNGYIRGLDGRKVYLTASHTLLNYYIQSAAAIIFKQWMVLMDSAITEDGVRMWQEIAYHDELQYEACPDVYPWAYSKLQETCLKSGESFEIKVPITCDIKVGFNWGDTH